MGCFYWSDFAIIDNLVAINKSHLLKLGYVDTNDKRVITYAYFDDGYIIKLFYPTRKFFYKRLKAQIEKLCEMQFEDITKEVTNNTKNDNNELIK